MKTKAELEEDIRFISDLLQKPNVSDIERRLLHEDRKDIRKLIETEQYLKAKGEGAK